MRHISGYMAHSGCRVKSVCDLSEEKEKEFYELYEDLGIEFKDSADEILDDPNIQVVSIATFDNYHYEQICRALDNGKHVFVEKPLCLNVKEAEGIWDKLVAAGNLKISSNLILRKSPRFEDLKDKINCNELGQLYRICGSYNYGRLHKIMNGWRAEIDFYSVIYGGGVHLVDLMMWLVGQDVKSVAAFGNDMITEGTLFKNKSFQAGLLHFENGIVGQVNADYCCVYPHFHKLSVYGAEATFENGWDHALLYSTRDPSIEPEKIDTAYPGAQKGDLLYDFIDAIIHDREPMISRKDVFDVMSVCFALEQASDEKRVINVEYFRE